MGAARFAHLGERNPGKPLAPAVEHAICGEVNDAVLVQARVHDRRVAGGEEERFEALLRRS